MGPNICYRMTFSEMREQNRWHSPAWAVPSVHEMEMLSGCRLQISVLWMLRITDCWNVEMMQPETLPFEGAHRRVGRERASSSSHRDAPSVPVSLPTREARDPARTHEIWLE